MQKADTHKELAILPHIGLKEYVDLGDYIVVSSKDLDKYCSKKLATKLNNFLKLYRDINARNIDNLGVVFKKQPKTKAFPILSDEERSSIKDVVNILSFSVTTRGGLFRFTQDNFFMTRYQINPDIKSDGITFRTRRFWNHMQKTDYMLQIPEFVTYQILEDRHVDPDLLRALSQSLGSDNADDIRILRAIDWYNQSQSDSPNLSDYNRFILLALAFETLLNTPHENIVSYFRNSIQLLLGADPDIDKWAKDFYDNRSAIVHGGKLPELLYGQYRHNSHLELAKIVFFQCLIKKLDLMYRFFPKFHYASLHREDITKYLVSQKERFAEIKKFKLNTKEKDTVKQSQRSRFIRLLWTLDREPDRSITREDCKNVLTHLVKIGLEGIKNLKKKAEFKEQVYQDFLEAYKKEFEGLINGDSLTTARLFKFSGVYSVAPGETEVPDYVLKESRLRAASIDKYMDLRLDSITNVVNDIIHLAQSIYPYS